MGMAMGIGMDIWKTNEQPTAPSGRVAVGSDSLLALFDEAFPEDVRLLDHLESVRLVERLLLEAKLIGRLTCGRRTRKAYIENKGGGGGVAGLGTCSSIAW